MSEHALENSATAGRARISTRDERLDRLRGFGVLLMVSDHVIAVAMALAFARGTALPTAAVTGADIFRSTVTRLALPVFAGLSGYLLADRDRASWRRIVQLACAAALSQALFTSLPGLADIDVLLVLLLAFSLWPLVRSRPIEAAVIGVVVAFNLPPFPLGLTGYHVGLIVAFMALGALARRLDAEAVPVLRLALPAWLAWLGRRPLRAYVTHLLVLKVIVTVL